MSSHYQNGLPVGHCRTGREERAHHRHHPPSRPPPSLPHLLIFLHILLLLFLCLLPSAMSAPGIPDSWEKCPDQGSCQNGGICYSDGISEFCICDDGYGGQKCERLIDAISFFDTVISTEQLARLCKFAFLLGVCALLAAFCGWACCCMKHLNARRLYLQNLKLARENRHLHEGNQRLSKRTIRLYAALARAKGLIGQQGEEEEEVGQIISAESTPTAEFGGGIRSNRAISADSRQSLGAQQSPNHRVLIRELSEMHDELRKSIEGTDRVVEILQREEEEGGGGENRRPKWWNWDRMKERIMAMREVGRRAAEQDGERQGRHAEDHRPLRPKQQRQENNHFEQ